MSFQSPWLLLSLVVLAAAVGVWLYAERRRMRYAVRFTNMDVLATVVSGRTWPRLVPPALFALGLAVLLVSLARPQVERMVLTERATVILVIDTSRSMQAQDVEPTRLGAAQEAVRTFLDKAPDRLRVGLVVFAGETQVATPADPRSRSRAHGRGRDRHLPDLRRNRDRRRAGDGRRPRETSHRRGSARG